MNEEIIDLVDNKNQITGKISRDQVHGNPTLKHRAVHVYVYHNSGQILLQKRAESKSTQPGKWDSSVGGHLLAGESYEEAAIRETKEELGITINSSDLELICEFTWSNSEETEYIQTFGLTHTGPFVTNLEEITNVKFWAPEEIINSLGTNTFTPNLEYEIQSNGILIFPMLNPNHPPAKKPLRKHLTSITRKLHDKIDDNIRHHSYPYLHINSETIQLDLFGSNAMIKWQDRKATASFLASESTSSLPQIYARYSTETGNNLALTICNIENAKGVLLTDCGMQACAIAFDTLFIPASEAIITRSVYNKTKTYLQRLAERQKSKVNVVDDVDYSMIAKSINSKTSIIFTETYSNPLMRALDPTLLSELIIKSRSKCKNIKVIVDNTIVTPWGIKEPLLDTEGIDVVVASGTKALSGQDQDMWGYIASNQLDFLNEASDLQAMRGGVLNWRTAKTVLAGFDTAKENFSIRCINAQKIALFLHKHPRVDKVFHPSLDNHPEKKTISKYYKNHGSIVSFRLLNTNEEETKHFCDVLVMTGVPRYALSFDGITTKINHHKSVSEYFTADKEIERIGVKTLIRIGTGLENPLDIIACLNWALWNAFNTPKNLVIDWQKQRKKELLITQEN